MKRSNIQVKHFELDYIENVLNEQFVRYSTSEKLEYKNGKLYDKFEEALFNCEYEIQSTREPFVSNNFSYRIKRKR